MSNSSNRQSDINTFLTIIEQQNNTIALLTKNGEDMQNTIRDLRQTIANLEETIAELNRRFFGISSEHSKNISLPADKESDIAEDISEDDAKEPPAKTKRVQNLASQRLPEKNFMLRFQSVKSNVHCRMIRSFVRTVVPR